MDDTSLSSRVLAMTALVVAAEAVFALPFHITRYFRPTFLDVTGFTHSELGGAQAVYGVVAMACYFPGGPLADRFQARTLVASALVATGLGGGVMMLLPDVGTMALLWGVWGMTSILLLWAALIRATREWGQIGGSSRAFGILDAGRGVFSIVLANLALLTFELLLPDTDVVDAAAKRGAVQGLIATYTVATMLAAALAYVAIPKSHAPVVDDDVDAEPHDMRDTLRTLLRMPSLRWHALVVVCAYISYKGLDTFGVLARDVRQFNDVEAARLSTLTAWGRPFAALLAGALATRWSSSAVCLASFVAVACGFIAIAVGASSGTVWLFVVEVGAASAMVFSLRAVYFALLDEAQLPWAMTGTAVGLVSVIGFSPDVFVGLVSGALLDAHPGIDGHVLFLWFLTASSVVGALATLGFQRTLSTTSS
mgnify:CR=1 FL=1